MWAGNRGDAVRKPIIAAMHILAATGAVGLILYAAPDAWALCLLAVLPLGGLAFFKGDGRMFTVSARLLFPISVGIAAVAFFHAFPTMMRFEAATPSIDGIRGDLNAVSQAFFEVNPIFQDGVSVLYAICVAFLLWKGLSDFDDLKTILYEEAAEVRAISDYLDYFLDDSSTTSVGHVRSMRCLLRSYLENMRDGAKVQVNAANDVVLRKLMIATRDLKAPDDNDKIALEEVMKGVTHLNQLRSRRMVAIEKEMSPFILGLMLLMSMTMCAGFLAKATGTVGVDYLYVFLLPAFYTAIFMTLLDLSSPFDGYWSIKTGALEGVLHHLADCIDGPVAPPLDTSAEMRPVPAE